MVEVVLDKVRFWEPDPKGWVHTIELSRNAPTCFISIWVCSPRHETIAEMEGLVSENPSLIQHDPMLFHADDEVYSWIEKRYPKPEQRHWRQHFHFCFPQDPGLMEVKELPKQIAISPALLTEVFNYLS